MINITNRLIYKNAEGLVTTLTSHLAGQKKILSSGFDYKVQIKQIAIGILEHGEAIPEHTHRDMDECYYILEGEGLISIEGDCYELRPNIFLNVPASSLHSIKSTSSSLSFLYFCLEIA